MFTVRDRLHQPSISRFIKHLLISQPTYNNHNHSSPDQNMTDLAVDLREAFTFLYKDDSAEDWADEEEDLYSKTVSFMISIL